MTYRSDSDFPFVYGRLRQTKAHPTDPEALATLVKEFGRKNRGKFEFSAGKNNGKSKRKGKAGAAWFVSNCETQSGREKFVEYLKKKIDVSTKHVRKIRTRTTMAVYI